MIKINQPPQNSGQLKRVISYSLYGSNPKYFLGAMDNIKIAKVIYPDWQVQIYVGSSITLHQRNTLVRMGALLIDMRFREDASAMLWRLHAFLDSDTDVVLIRDCDSRLGLRESWAVQEWIKSGRSLHIMRDHPFHTAFIMGGMWAAKASAVAPQLSFLKEGSFYSHAPCNYGDDQRLLEKTIYTVLFREAYVHDTFTLLSRSSKKFPRRLAGDSFVGEVIESDGTPNREHIRVLLAHEKSSLRQFYLKSTTLRKRILFEGKIIISMSYRTLFG